MARPSPFNPLGLLELAQRLNHGEEAELRTAISRAYYAMHLRHAQSLEASGKAVPSGAEAHSFVWRTLRSWHYVAGQRLSALFELRVRADYDMHAEMEQLTLDLTEAFDACTYISGACANAWDPSPTDLPHQTQS